jgi:hypothetical protein
MRQWWALVIGLAIGSSPAAAQDATIRIFDATLNEFANELQPITLRGTYKLSLHTFAGEVTLCESPYTVNLLQLRFATTPASVQLTGQVDATWCNLTVTAPLSTTANASYNPTQRAIIATISPTSIQPHVNVLGLDVALPVSVNAPASLNIPPIPVGVGQLSLQAVHGPVKLRLEPQNVSLLKRNGYLELQTDLAVW